MSERDAHSSPRSPSATARRTDPAGFVEEAFFFDGPRASLYGVLHLPGRAGREAMGPPIIHVHSYGIEQVAAYRIEVEFARAAAAAGFPVLRFHMTGAGDSFGDFAEITLSGMVEDVRRAARLVAERGLGGRPVLLGVRLGADVAVRAAVAMGGARALVLWEPVRDPRHYLEGVLRSLLVSNLAQGKRSADTVASLVERLRAEGSVDVLGYPVHRRIYEEAEPLAIPDGALVADDALVVSFGKRVRPAAGVAETLRLLAERGVRCETREVREEPGWQFNANPSFVSADLTEATISWCRERLTRGAGAAPSSPGAGPKAPTGRVEVR